ncbi:hypothetical protein [Marinobacter sp. F4218]|uniref:hypothetical protein n=1 Tax=Marinobacter sp. F4218 TaxID=2862868 RepID=UPI001C6369DD|nr:hypothetical protein [Marinobacter sp. F4218]MBW7471846.1 hypothetical protein [Marinobacter sp. F4218]
MRHFCKFSAIAFATLLLAGCGPEDSGPTAFNPATNVDLTFSTFTLTEQTENSLFGDLVPAVEPADANNSEAQAIADGIRTQLALFLGLTYAQDAGPSIESVRNPMDLMRRVIGENEVANFIDARQYISSRIDAGQAGEYSNTTNDVSIRFTDQKAFTEGLPVTEYNWRYPIAKWVYTPDTSGLVTRVISWVASGDFPADSTRPSATLGTEFRARDFQTSGYNDGARLHAEGSLVIKGERELAFIREYQDLNTDTVLIDGTAVGTSEGTQGGPEFEFAGDTVDCLKIEMDYAGPSVEVFTSLDQPPQMEDPDNPGQTMANPDYCLNQDTATAGYPTRQTGLRM